MNSSPIANPTPKQRFMELPATIHKHRELVDDPQFQQSIDFAMMQYTATLGTFVTNDDEAKAAGWRLRGMVDFVNVLRMLSEQPPRPKIIATQNLNHSES